MTRQEYKSKMDELNRIRDNARKEMLQLQQDYLRENIIYSPDEKVELVFKNQPKEIVFIRSCNIHSDGEIYYTFYKSKKDGTRSQVKFYYYGYEKYEIKKIEECQPAQNEESK